MQAFRKDWEANGPMVPGLEPMEAVDRLKKFQQLFEVWYSMHVNDQVSKHGLQQQSPHLSFAAHSLPVCCALHRRLQPHHPPHARHLGHLNHR